MSSPFYISLPSTLPAILGLGTVVIAFWYISKKKKEGEARKGSKNDLWYLVKEYLKVTDRQGYQIADLTFYARPNSISLLRDHILETKEMLEKQEEELLGIRGDKLKKVKEKVLKKLPLRKSISFFAEEEYHRKMELYTLKVISKKYSYSQELLQEYQKLQKNEAFQSLLNSKLVGEALSKIAKDKKINSRNRYVVCFKTINKSKNISPWEAIEIELLKNPKPKSKEKFKVLFTASLDYSRELHWIYAPQFKYEQNKKIEAESISKTLEKEDKKKKRREKIKPYLSLPKEYLSKIRRNKNVDKAN